MVQCKSIGPCLLSFKIHSRVSQILSMTERDESNSSSEVEEGEDSNVGEEDMFISINEEQRVCYSLLVLCSTGEFGTRVTSSVETFGRETEAVSGTVPVV